MKRFSILILLAVVSSVSAADPQPLVFHLSFDPTVRAEPFTGRVYVMLSKREAKELRSGYNWFDPEPTYALDVKNWKPGERVTIGKRAISYPTPLEKLPKAKYTIQAVMDLDRSLSFSTSEGNIYCESQRLELDPQESGPVELILNQTYKPRPFVEDERVKLVEIESKLLSKFHGKPEKMRAAVVLPKSFGEKKEKKYPIVYEIPGFSGTHRSAFNRTRDTEQDGLEVLYAVLDPSCRLGHHVFADSANNGPCGRALIEELIPAIESRFRAVGEPWSRIVTGHSSGGWSSLWLQVTYPDFFGGCWSTAPDPVDFRDFQRINLYEDGVNFFSDAKGSARPLARIGGKPTLFFRGFSDMEVVMGHGGQLASFEAVFSPREKGTPRKLWDRETGKIDPETARSWERYDIRLILERNWKALSPKLSGKLHVYMGSEDTFYLDGAVRLLQESLKNLGSDAVVEMFDGKNHSTLMDKKMRERIAAEMAKELRKHVKE